MSQQPQEVASSICALHRRGSMCRISLLGFFVGPIRNNQYKWSLINTPFVHVHVTRRPDLLTSCPSRLPGSRTRKLSSGHLAPGRPAVLALMRRRRRQRRRSGGSPHLELPKLVHSKGDTHRRTTSTHNRTQPHAHLGTRRRDPSHTVSCEPNWKGCLRASF